MKNWSIDEKELKKDKKAYIVWRLEQLINYGLEGEKLDKKLVKKYWNKIEIDPAARQYLQFLLWPKKHTS